MDKNKMAVALFDKLATLYQEKYMNVSCYADTLDFFCDKLKIINAEVLELACGPGNITQYVLKRRPDLKILGTDLSENMVELAKINNPNAKFQIMDCRKITTLQQKYDAIICGFCLPYLTKEETIALIGDISKGLKSKGLLYISTIEDDYSKSGFKKGSTGEEIFMHYYPADCIIAILEENDFEILNIFRKIDKIQHPPNTDLIIISRLK